MTSVVFASLIAIPLVLGHVATDRAALSYRLKPVSQITNEIGIAQRYKLAKDGDAVSQVLIGIRYLELRNTVKALYWFEKSASQGNAEAQIHLGDAYARGLGVSVDLVKALTWLNIAAAQGGYEAKFRVEYLSSRMTPEQIAEAQGLAQEWRQRAK